MSSFALIASYERFGFYYTYGIIPERGDISGLKEL
jgi:hypothetical protein